MPELVISASVYVNSEEVTSPETATEYIEKFNNEWVRHGITIVLPDRHDPGSSRWEPVGP